MPNKKLIFTTLVFALSFLGAGCSDVQNNIITPQSISIHPAGYGSFASADFHGKQFLKNYNWSLTECQKCHSAQYTGGTAQKSCLGAGCHNTPKGPEACNTCHGVFADSTKIAPPRDITGGFLFTSTGVGAHTAHLDGGDLGRKTECSWCHKVPGTLNETGHLDASRGAELIFDSVAVTKTDTLKPVPVYSATLRTCSNTYCHGYFKNGNKTNSPKWNSGGITCGSCHGNGSNPLPGGTHMQVQNCKMCHSSVIDAVTITATDTVYTFKDKTKHINGVINY